MVASTACGRWVTVVATTAVKRATFGLYVVLYLKEVLVATVALLLAEKRGTRKLGFRRHDDHRVRYQGRNVIRQNELKVGVRDVDPYSRLLQSTRGLRPGTPHKPCVFGWSHACPRPSNVACEQSK